MRVKLGDRVKDEITGYEGIVVCISEWLNGCRRITIQAAGLHEGKPITDYTTDETDVQLLATNPLKRIFISATADTSGLDAASDAIVREARVVRPGGDRPSPTRASDPK